MSSKFRTGFLICSERRRYLHRSRNGTFSTTINSCRSSSSRHTHDGYRVCFKPGSNSVVIRNCNDSPESNRSGDSRANILGESPVLAVGNAVRRMQHYAADVEEEDFAGFGNGNPNFNVTTEKIAVYHDVSYDRRVGVVAFDEKTKSYDRNLV